MTNLVIFDIDGTLINSSKVDADCFVKAVEETFGITNIDTRWENYRHVTDGGIFEEAFEKHFERKPNEQEIKRQIEKFVSCLKESFEQNPLLFKEIHGAGKLLHVLIEHPKWKPAIATGTWKECALFKLQAAGLDVSGIPLTTSSDSHSREKIIHKSISAAKVTYGVEHFEKIVSIGDAVWDQTAALKLGFSFIKIATDEADLNSTSMRVLKDFADSQRFLRYLEEPLNA